jgi:hypothetical protein
MAESFPSGLLDRLGMMEEVEYNLMNEEIEALSLDFFHVLPEHVTSINLHGNRLSSLASFCNHYKQLQHLTDLNLSSNRFMSADLPELAHLPLLQSLDLSGNLLKSVLDLPFLPGLVNLYLAYNQIDNLYAIHESCPNLEHIDLRDNAFTREEDLACLHQLQHNRSIAINYQKLASRRENRIEKRFIVDLFDSCPQLKEVDGLLCEDWDESLAADIVKSAIKTPRFDMLKARIHRLAQQGLSEEAPEDHHHNSPIIIERSSFAAPTAKGKDAVLVEDIPFPLSIETLVNLPNASSNRSSPRSTCMHRSPSAAKTASAATAKPSPPSKQPSTPPPKIAVAATSPMTPIAKRMMIDQSTAMTPTKQEADAEGGIPSSSSFSLTIQPLEPSTRDQEQQVSFIITSDETEFQHPEVSTADKEANTSLVSDHHDQQEAAAIDLANKLVLQRCFISWSHHIDLQHQLQAARVQWIETQQQHELELQQSSAQQQQQLRDYLEREESINRNLQRRLSQLEIQLHNDRQQHQEAERMQEDRYNLLLEAHASDRRSAQVEVDRLAEKLRLQQQRYEELEQEQTQAHEELTNNYQQRIQAQELEHHLRLEQSSTLIHELRQQLADKNTLLADQRQQQQLSDDALVKEQQRVHSLQDELKQMTTRCADHQAAAERLTATNRQLKSRLQSIAQEMAALKDRHHQLGQQQAQKLVLLQQQFQAQLIAGESKAKEGLDRLRSQLQEDHGRHERELQQRYEEQLARYRDQIDRMTIDCKQTILSQEQQHTAMRTEDARRQQEELAAIKRQYQDSQRKAQDLEQRCHDLVQELLMLQDQLASRSLLEDKMIELLKRIEDDDEEEDEMIEDVRGRVFIPISC